MIQSRNFESEREYAKRLVNELLTPQWLMQYGIIFEKIEEADFLAGYYYAHIPTLGLTTHGIGVEGARAAAIDLIKLWVAEKRAKYYFRRN
jgi:predicted RNase H-like HicB family nuclease